MNHRRVDQRLLLRQPVGEAGMGSFGNVQEVHDRALRRRRARQQSALIERSTNPLCTGFGRIMSQAAGAHANAAVGSSGTTSALQKERVILAESFLTERSRAPPTGRTTLARSFLAPRREDDLERILFRRCHSESPL